MVYIYTEDSTSGKDFVETIITRVLKPKSTFYTVVSLFGCDNIQSCCRRIREKYKSGDVTAYDIFIFYIDNYNRNERAILSIASLCEIGLTVYVANYFCFESVFFSYKYKDLCIAGRVVNSMYSEFATLLLQEKPQEWDAFKRKYMNISGLTLKGVTTIEQAATHILCYYFRTTPCVLVNKLNYGVSLDTLSKYRHRNVKFPNGKIKNGECQSRLFYNNGCNLYCKGYCESRRRLGICQRAIADTTDNLSDFYYNSILSKPLLCLSDKRCSKPLHKILR